MYLLSWGSAKATAIVPIASALAATGVHSDVTKTLSDEEGFDFFAEVGV